MRNQDDGEAAIARYREALSADPTLIQAHLNLARLLQQQGRDQEAGTAWQALLQRDPNQLEALRQLGLLERAAGRPERTLTLWQRAVSLEPTHSDTRADLGTLLRGLRRHEEAINQLREALRLNPGHVASTLSLGFTLLDTGHIGEALALARPLVAELVQRAELTGHAESAQLAEAYNLLGFALAEHGWPDQASDAFRQALAQQADSQRIIANLLFASLFDDQISANELTDLHRHWGERLHQLWLAQPHKDATSHRHAPVPNPAPAGNGQRPLRIGYLSADLRQHPVGRFLLPILSHHDPAQVTVSCYHASFDNDALTATLRKHAHHWVECAGLGDADLTERTRADGIDILVDLGGHSAGNRAAVLSHRPATIQAQYLGYPATSELPEVDYIIANPRLVPPALRPLYTETVIEQPDSFSCYQPPQDTPEPASRYNSAATTT